MNAHAEVLSPAAVRVAEAFEAAVAKRQGFNAPYRHYLLENVFPDDVSEELAHLPFAPPELNGVSGKRELHNDQRSYFDAEGVKRFPVMRGVAEALQSTRIARVIHEAFAHRFRREEIYLPDLSFGRPGA